MKCILLISLWRIIFGKMHFLLISENEFFHEIKCNGIDKFHGIYAAQEEKYEDTRPKDAAIEISQARTTKRQKKKKKKNIKMYKKPQKM